MAEMPKEIQLQLHVQSDQITVATKRDIEKAFAEWERRYREEPEQFMSDQERLAETEETLGGRRAAYLIELLGEAGEAGYLTAR